jgi:hypothetical protein
MPYQFGYNIDDGYGNKQDRQEKGFSNIYTLHLVYSELGYSERFSCTQPFTITGMKCNYM